MFFWYHKLHCSGVSDAHLDTIQRKDGNPLPLLRGRIFDAKQNGDIHSLIVHAACPRNRRSLTVMLAMRNAKGVQASAVSREPERSERCEVGASPWHTAKQDSGLSSRRLRQVAPACHDAGYCLKSGAELLNILANIRYAGRGRTYHHPTKGVS